VTIVRCCGYRMRNTVAEVRTLLFPVRSFITCRLPPSFAEATLLVATSVAMLLCQQLGNR
jgi:hypothetical protein